MNKIDWKNLPSTDTPIDAENLNLMQANIENAINGEILYQSEDGSTNSVTLNKSVAEFDFIDITVSAQNSYKTFRVINPNGKNINENMYYVLGNLWVMVFSSFVISGNLIAPILENCGYWNINISANALAMQKDENNYLAITKVVGYKN